MTDAWPWESMIAEFTALGGVAENVRPGQGEFGPGLFPIDPSKRIRLQVPPHLLIKEKAVALEDGLLRIKREVEIGERVRAFFERYHASYSWGAAGQRDSMAFIEAIASLPAGIKRLLIDDFKMNELFPDQPLRAIAIFLQSRTISVDGSFVMMPVIELVNHAPGQRGFVQENGMNLDGRFAGEILANYCTSYTSDAIGMFRNWGFASREPAAFSMPLRLRWGEHAVTVQRRLARWALLDAVQVPSLDVEGNTITLSHLLLGNRTYPELPAQIFAEMMRKTDMKDAGALFNEIRRLNRVKIQTLMDALAPHQGAGVSLLQKIGNYQLEALASGPP